MVNKYFSDIDEFLRPDFDQPFDRTRFSRRKGGERRVSCSSAVMSGQIVRNESDRRGLEDRRRSWRNSSENQVDGTSWET